MEQRLHRAGIVTVAQPWNATPFQLRRVWAASTICCSTRWCTASTSSPPPPAFRKHRPSACAGAGSAHAARRARFCAAPADQGGRAVAARRLLLRRLGLHLSWVANLGGWWEETDFHETHDTGFLLAGLESSGGGCPAT